MRRLALVLSLLLAAAAAQAQSVAYTGRMGDRAVLLIDGQPRTLKPGDSAQGVKLIAVDERGAQLEWGGARHTLMLGSGPSRGGAGSPAGGDRIVLTAVTGGHFVASGSIRGAAMRFLVDTGATGVAMSVQQAEAAGVPWRQGTPVAVSTANGTVAAYRVLLDRVRVGDVELNGIEGVVVEQAMPMVLLGNSFLSRFQMERTNDQLVLTRRY